MIKFYLTFILFLVLFFKAYSQEKDSNNNYIPKNLESVENYLEKINSDYIKRINGKYSSEIKKIFKDRDEKVIKSIKDSTYIFSSDINEPLDEIITVVYNANPEIDRSNYRFFINSSFIPNAACYGDGMFEINLGLFTTLNYDDEIAFVICHEIAHKILDHTLHHVTNAISSINSKVTKKKVKKIKKQKYGRTRAALSVIDELSIDILDHSKEAEAQADSLGYILFSKTKYNRERALTALEKLKTEGDMLLSHNVKLDSVFDFATYPFKDIWLKETTSIFDTKEEINEFKLNSDTLKTHPEIEFRVEKLMKDFSLSKTDISGKKEQINLINEVSHLKAIQSTIDKKLLDFAIYQLVEKYQNNHINSDYYYITMATVLKQVYDAKKNHELGKYVPSKSSFSDEKHLNEIRLFLHNIELNETKKMGLAFCETHKVVLKTNDRGTAIYDFFKFNNR